MFALICNAFAVTLCLLLPLFKFLLLPLFQLPLLALIQNLGFGMASEYARFSFTSLLTGSTFRPVWGPGNLTGGSEPKWAGSGRKVRPVNKDDLHLAIDLQNKSAPLLGFWRSRNQGFETASESVRFSFTSLLTGSTFRPDPA